MPVISGSIKIAAVQATAVYLDRGATIDKACGLIAEAGRDSAIENPDGEFIADPLHNEEGILYAEVDPAQMSGPKWMLDVAGHYARPDVFELIVHTDARPMLTSQAGAPGPDGSTPRKTTRRQPAKT